jgi:hypothetical protein
MEVSTYIKVMTNHIVTYKKFHTSKKREKKETELDNLKKGKSGEYNGYMSPTTSRKVKEIITAWVECVNQRNLDIENNLIKGKKSTITFVTLTLSSKQMNDDNFIKRFMLGSFVKKIKDNESVENYFWRAEPQKNGNIHFHIITDTYIPYNNIRTYWNRIQEKFGYIKPFIEKFGHNNPNSTDIHKVKEVKNVSAYLCKYVAKKDEEKESRKIEGRIWGCSDNLKELKVFRKEVEISMSYKTVYAEEKTISTLKEIESSKDCVKIINSDDIRVLITKVPVLEVIKKVDKELSKEIQFHYRDLYKNFRIGVKRKKVQVFRV